MAAKNIFIVAAKRTPFGSFGGSLKGISATDLGVHSTKAALAAGKVDPSLVDAVYFGNVIQSSTDAAYLARHVQLKSGMSVDKPALTINRLCGSGFETVILGAHSILLGESSIVACGGTENMSNAPMAVDGNAARWGVALGQGMQMEDRLWSGLTDSYAKLPMGMTAENLAKQYSITRQVSKCVIVIVVPCLSWMTQRRGFFEDVMYVSVIANFFYVVCLLIAWFRMHLSEFLSFMFRNATNLPFEVKVCGERLMIWVTFPMKWHQLN
jgi:hypothetical protein